MISQDVIPADDYLSAWQCIDFVRRILITINPWKLKVVQWNPDFSNLQGKRKFFEKSGVREMEGGIKLHLIGRVLFDYEYVFKF